MRSMLFDDQGELRDAQSRRFIDELQASIAGEELADYAVRNLGFVAVKELNGSLRISLRPAMVSPVALGALLYWLHDRKADRILVSFFDRAWSHEMLPSRQQAARRLLARTDMDVGSREGDFLHKALSLDQLSPSSPLDGVLTMWRQSAGTFDRERLEPLLAKALNGRFVLVEASPERPYMVIKDVGGGLSKPAEYWLTRSIGHRVEDQPDYDYGRWVARFYKQVLAERAPSLSDVDAVITWPQQARRSFRYRRLVLPFDGQGSSTMLLCASIIDPSINLRVKPAQEVGNARQ